jgi:hypothetical protein
MEPCHLPPPTVLTPRSFQSIAMLHRLTPQRAQQAFEHSRRCAAGHKRALIERTAVEDSVEQRGDPEGYGQKQHHPPEEDGSAE